MISKIVHEQSKDLILLAGSENFDDASGRNDALVRGMLAEDTGIATLIPHKITNLYEEDGLESRVVGIELDMSGQIQTEIYAAQAVKRLDNGLAEYIFAHGLSLSKCIAADPKAEGKLISWFSKNDLMSDLDDSDAARKAIHLTLDASCLVIVDDEFSRVALIQLVPEFATKILILCTSSNAGSPSPVNSVTPRQIVSFVRARHRVLIFDDLVASTAPGIRGDANPTHAASPVDFYSSAYEMGSRDVQIIRLTANGLEVHDGLDIRRNNCITISPQIVERHLIDGVLAPRYAGWYLAVAARSLGCNIVLPADIETVKSAATNSFLRKRVWPTLTAVDWSDAKRKLFHKEAELFAKIRRIVVPSEGIRSILETRIPEITGKTVVLPWLDLDGVLVGCESMAEKLAELADHASVGHFTPNGDEPTKKILFVGHDFKFAGDLIDQLSVRGEHEVRIEKWVQQNVQDVSVSQANADWADIVVCEFASHNSVWYSWEKRPGQKLIIHFHGYELFSDWIRDINISNVDGFVFVSAFYRSKVIAELNWQEANSFVIPNMIDSYDLAREKLSDARFHIGIAGIVPVLKRPDRALDLLEALLEDDSRYTLHIRGRNPWDYSWMWKDESVRDSYEAFYERLVMNPRLRSRVSFDGFGPDMGRWFQKIGWMLSPSTRETFHLAPIEGMASGAIPVVWEREGASEIFDSKWIHEDTAKAAHFIRRINSDPQSFRLAQVDVKTAVMVYGIDSVSKKWTDLIFDTSVQYDREPSKMISSERVEALFSRRPDVTRFGWLIRTLIRDGRESRVEQLIDENPRLFDALPYETFGAFIMERGLIRVIRSASAIPKRNYGSVYLTIHNSVLEVLDSDTSHTEKESRPDWIKCLLSSAQIMNERVLGAQSESQQVSGKIGVEASVLVAADQIVRDARVSRPALVVGSGSAWACVSGLIAARRVGVPFVLDLASLGGNVSEDVAEGLREESDLVLTTEQQEIDIAQVCASYDGFVERTGQRKLANLRIGLIADQFTTRTVSESFVAIPLRRNDGYLQVAAENLDAIFIESAWEGPNDEWRRGVAYHPDRIADLKRIVDVARLKNIPLIFWNKEDPVHFHNFKGTAALMDFVFTTDSDRVSDYLRISESNIRAAASLPFYAQPIIHNPLNHDRPYDHSVAYAGTYYGDRFKERSVELHQILEAAAVHGLTIYDRQVNVPDSPYRFPAELAKFVREGVPYDEVLKVYKAHPVSINVNSARDSPTMFSRRVVEVAASGGVVLSGKGQGITQQIGEILATDDPAIWRSKLSLWMSDEGARIREAWSQLRCIARSHLADQALTLMFRTAGIPVSYVGLPSYAIEVQVLSESMVRGMLSQTWLPSAAIVGSDSPASLIEKLRKARIQVVQHRADLDPSVEWVAHGVPDEAPTYFEDVLHAHRFGMWAVIKAITWDESMGRGVALATTSDRGEGDFPVIERLFTDVRDAGKVLWWVLAPTLE
ncbi:hypothetical protein AAFM46_10475 [Arthrobacter sp. TMP15]|uniref:glycosyltransferase family protein n=1 Tax=Arthrobacter sp. TMP15 TaxID=3140789 RepID=UPI0031BAFA11